jgi:hypothetical protein
MAGKPDSDIAFLPAPTSAMTRGCLASQAKGALMVVDDYVPTGRHNDSALKNAAEHLFRSAGNHQGRSRMSGSGRPSALQPPRALLLATRGTGELGCSSSKWEQGM